MTRLAEQPWQAAEMEAADGTNKILLAASRRRPWEPVTTATLR
jgi:hypothetical protein